MPCKNEFPPITEADKPLIEKLSEKHQAILGVSNLSYAAIEQALQLNSGTVRSRLHRARAALKRLRDKQLTPKPDQTETLQP